MTQMGGADLGWLLFLLCYILAGLGVLSLFVLDYVSWKEQSVFGWLKAWLQKGAVQAQKKNPSRRR